MEKPYFSAVIKPQCDLAKSSFLRSKLSPKSQKITQSCKSPHWQLPFWTKKKKKKKKKNTSNRRLWKDLNKDRIYLFAPSGRHGNCPNCPDTDVKTRFYLTLFNSYTTGTYLHKTFTLRREKGRQAGRHIGTAMGQRQRNTRYTSVGSVTYTSPSRKDTYYRVLRMMQEPTPPQLGFSRTGRHYTGILQCVARARAVECRCSGVPIG